MGYSSFDSVKWEDYSKTVRTASVDSAFTRRDLDDKYNPSLIKLRESRDSVANPNSTLVAVFLDVTGSMGSLPLAMIKKDFGVLASELIARKPITDPSIMLGAIGDANYDDYPLQVSQAEADVAVVKQMQEMVIEGGGGGNRGESYNMPWWFAANRISMDNFEKRDQKGFLFTVGDEPPLDVLMAKHIKEFFGEAQAEDITTTALLAQVERKFHVFHIIVEESPAATDAYHNTHKLWQDLLGNHVIPLEKHSALAEVIVSTIQVTMGEDTDKVIKSWNGDTSLVVAEAVGKLKTKSSSSSGIHTF